MLFSRFFKGKKIILSQFLIFDKFYILRQFAVANRGDDNLSVIPVSNPELNYVAQQDSLGEYYVENVGSAEQCQAIIDAYHNDVSDEASPVNSSPVPIQESSAIQPALTLVCQMDSTKEKKYLAQIHDLKKSLNAARAQLLRYKELMAHQQAEGNIN